MIKVLISVCLVLNYVECGSDLCKNGGKVDSIIYIDGKDMWFFTSGGHYWLLGGTDFPPKSAGTPLPGGFKRGDAAFYRDTLKACPGEENVEQEIHVMEFIDDENKVLVYDTRTNTWVNENSPQPYNKDRFLGQAKVDMTKPIDAAFIYKKTNLVVLQGTRYSVVDIQNICKDKNAWGEGKQNQPTSQLNVMSKVDATAGFNDSYFYLFQYPNYWKVEIRSFKQSVGELTTVKNVQQDIVTDFFKLPEDCRLPEEYDIRVGQSDTPSTSTTPEPETIPELQTEEITSETEPIQESETEPEIEPSVEPAVDSTKESDEEGFPWIIIIVIIIIILIIAIILIVCLAMRRKDKEKDKESAQAVASTSSSMASRSKSNISPKAKSSSKLGDSPSTMSVRSNAGLGGSGKKKSTSKVSSLGSSASTMSIRSNPGVANTTTNSKVSKTGSKK